jgi:uncharacterized membrane protein YgdD (TMEM256/DUF423 family)
LPTAAILAIPPKHAGGVAVKLMTLGTILFSGSIYALVLTRDRRLGMVTPMGGLVMTAGWFALLL